jgi:hypothetical protein
MNRDEVLKLARRIFDTSKPASNAKKLARWILLNEDRLTKEPPLRFTPWYAAKMELRMGLAKTFTLRIRPKGAPFTPARIVANSPTPEFVLLDDERLAKDSFDYSPTSMAQECHTLKPVEPEESIVIHASYTGLIPPGYRERQHFLFILHISGKEMVMP